MNRLFTALFAAGVACVTGLAYAQAPAPEASQPAATQPAVTGQQSAAAPTAGGANLQGKIAMCLGCHNIPGYRASFPEVYSVPMIAGQSAKYIVAALHAYQSGDRKHPTMRGVATSLSEQDINAIADYYAALGRQGGQPLGDKLAKEPDAQVAGLMQKAACVSCHGPNLSKPIDPTYPKISGQHADYLFVALKAYKTENNPAMGRNNGVMGAIAKQFSNAELKALSGYIGSLQSELHVKPESRFR